MATATPVISPVEEIAAYEALWTRYSTFPKLAELFRRYEHALPSAVAQAEGIPAAEVAQIKQAVAALMPYHQSSA
jgi:DNA processing protein